MGQNSRKDVRLFVVGQIIFCPDSSDLHSIDKTNVIQWTKIHSVTTDDKFLIDHRRICMTDIVA